MAVLEYFSGRWQSSGVCEKAGDVRGVAGRHRRCTLSRCPTSAHLSGGRQRRRRLAVPTVSAPVRDRLRDDRVLRQRLLAERASAVDHRRRGVRHAGDRARRRRAGGGGRRETGGGRRRPVARRGDRDGRSEQRSGADDDTARRRVRRGRGRRLGAGALDGVLYAADAGLHGSAASTALYRRTTAAAHQRRETTPRPSSVVRAACSTR